MKITDLAEHLEHFRMRVFQDALNEATAAYWLKRAEQFDAVGNDRCDEVAQACRNRATLALGAEIPHQVLCPSCATRTSPWSCSCGETWVGGEAR